MLCLYYAMVDMLDPNVQGEPLSEYRTLRLARTSSRIHRQQSIGAERLLNAAVSAVRPDLTPPLDIAVTKTGKPYLRQDGLFFSISHSGNLAACAVADHVIGLDVQADHTYSERFAHRFFTPQEQETLLLERERDFAFTRLWVMKESYLKAEGSGLYTPLSAFSIDLDGHGIPGACFWYAHRNGFHFSLCSLHGLEAAPYIWEEHIFC